MNAGDIPARETLELQPITRDEAFGYTGKSEPGTSLIAAGFKVVAERPARSWNMPGRPRVDRHRIEQRVLWEVIA